MNRNSFFLYITVSLAVLIPVPGRFAYGIIIIAAIDFLMITAVLFNKLLVILEFKTLKPVCILLFLVCSAVLFKQLVILYSPVFGLALGILLFLPVIAVLMLSNFFENHDISLTESLKENMSEAAWFSAYACIFFLLREIVGYGTITFPAPSGNVKLVFPSLPYFSPFVFFASVPGGIFLAGILLVLFSGIKRKCMIICRSSELREENDNVD